MALPANVTYGTVVGTFLTAVADTPDDGDRDPQGVAATGLKFRFTADLDPAIVRDGSSTPPTMFALAAIDCTVGADGSLLGPDGAPGVKLVASTNTALDPNGWTWRVALSGTGFPNLQFSFLLDPGATVDLATVLQVPSSPGGTLNAWLAAVTAAQAARDAAVAAAATVPSAASLAATYATLAQLAANPDQLAVGTIVRSSTGAATGFSVIWPDGAAGVFAGTESTTTPGAIDSYTVTHVKGGTTVTYTQPALARNPAGAVTSRPAITVA